MIQVACRSLVALLMVLGGVIAPSAVADERADIRAALLLNLERALQQSDGNAERISAVANTVVEARVDLASLVVMYAGRNLIRVAIETGEPPVNVLPNGNKLPANEKAVDGDATEIYLALATMQAPRSTFRQELTKFVAAGEPVPRVTEVLQRTVENYSLGAILEGITKNRKSWPFPFCLPRCE